MTVIARFCSLSPDWIYLTLQAVAAFLQDPEGQFAEDAEPATPATLIIAPDSCYQHHTCPEPLTRSSRDVPPENGQRLRVLTHPGQHFCRPVHRVDSWQIDSAVHG